VPLLEAVALDEPEGVDTAGPINEGRLAVELQAAVIKLGVAVPESDDAPEHPNRSVGDVARLSKYSSPSSAAEHPPAWGCSENAGEAIEVEEEDGRIECMLTVSSLALIPNPNRSSTISASRSLSSATVESGSISKGATGGFCCCCCCS